jgi:hypothetical protein
MDPETPPINMKNLSSAELFGVALHRSLAAFLRRYLASGHG